MPVNRRTFTPQQTGHLNGLPQKASMPANGHQQSEQAPLLAPQSSTKADSDARPLLTTYEESLRDVPWQTDNEWILTGYRRQMPSIRSCLWSAVGYLHNETVNIHSHSLGALFFLVLLPLHLFPTHFPSFFSSFGAKVGDPTPVPPTLHDKLAMAVYCLSAVGCLSLSSWFHTVQCHSKTVCDAAHRGDYIGIVILIVGSILPGLYYCFYDSPVLRAVYMGGILTAGITSGYIVLSPHHRSHRWHRTLTFIALGLSAVVPMTHVVLSRGLVYARQQGSLDLVVGGGLAYIVGAVMYAARFPEHLIPGKVDYFGNSHQIFHIFVLVGAGLQYAALRGMVWGRSTIGSGDVQQAF